MGAPLRARGKKIAPLTAITPRPRLLTAQGEGAQRKRKGSLAGIRWYKEGQ